MVFVIKQLFDQSFGFMQSFSSELSCTPVPEDAHIIYVFTNDHHTCQNSQHKASHFHCHHIQWLTINKDIINDSRLADLKTQFLQWPAVGLCYILSGCRDISLRDKHSSEPKMQVLLHQIQLQLESAVCTKGSIHKDTECHAAEMISSGTHRQTVIKKISNKQQKTMYNQGHRANIKLK